MWTQNLCRNWHMRRADETQAIPAIVPGSVYTDLLREGKMENPFWKDNEDKALALMEYDYEYSCEFDCDKQEEKADIILLHFDGLDTIADVALNGVFLGSTNNMHRIWEYDVTRIIKEQKNQLKVYFHSPTKWIADAFAQAPTRGSDDAMQGFVHMRKAHCMFGWDWGAHLPDAGIFRPVSLIGIDSARIDSVNILQDHESDKVTLELQVELNHYQEEKKSLYDCVAEQDMPFSYQVVITNPLGQITKYADSPVYIEIQHPMLWWPNGYGDQNLYTIEVTLYQEGRQLDSWSRRIGLRTLTMDRSKNEWGENFHTTINGVQIFAMGADYIPEDHLLGRVNPDTTRSLLEKAVFAHFNTIRVWGGGYYPDEWFFDLCDEMGLIVWQDFMFACGVYDLTPEFEENITQEFVENIKRMRSHASLGLFCGNNEMEQFVDVKLWISKQSEIHDYIIMYERILPGLVKKLAPQTFYWPSSPSSGGTFDKPSDPERGDVHYWDVWHGNKPFTEYRKFYFRYLSEFGFQSFPCKKTIETFTDDEKDWNIFSYVMEKHQRNGSANGKVMNYMQQMYLYPTDFDTLLYASQLLQADGVKYGVEHFRRNRGRCMGTVYWQLNDCWPVASWSSIDYCQRMKALHYYARRFYAPLMISCEEQGMMSANQVLNWQPFSFEKSIKLNVVNETREKQKTVVKWQLRNASGKIVRSEQTEIEVAALSSVWLDKVELPDVDIYQEYVSYQLEQEGNTVSEGTVIFSYPKYFHYEDPTLQVRVNGNQLTVSAQCYAKSIEIQNENEDLVVSDNYFDLNGGEKTVEVLSGDLSKLRLRSVYDIR